MKPKRKFRNLNAHSLVKVTGVKILACMERSCQQGKCIANIRCISIGMGVMINELVGANADTNANANAEANDSVITLALLGFVRRAKNTWTAFFQL